MREQPLTQALIGHYPMPDHFYDEVIRGVAMGLPRAVAHAPLPSLDVVPVQNPGTFGGRYFPRRNAIVAYGAVDPEVLLVTVLHEGGHWRSYVETCGRPSGRSACGYHGDHDHTFYAILGPIYRAYGVSGRAIQTVEGDYPYPRAWLAWRPK